MTDIPPSRGPALGAALEASGGTVTQFLEHLAGEPVDADILAQGTEPAGFDDVLGLEPGAPLLRREVLLTGRDTGRRFVYAESAIAADRLPALLEPVPQGGGEPVGGDSGLGVDEPPPGVPTGQEDLPA